MEAAQRAVATKRALLVERLGGPLNALTAKIERLGYEVLRASDANAVTGLVGSLRRLSLVIVNGDGLRADPARLVGAIKERHPDLPILWLQADRAAAPRKVDYVSSELDKLEMRLDRMVSETFYSPSFIRAVVAGAQAVFEDSGAIMQASEACIKSSLTSLNELTSFIFFYGPGLAGHTILTASEGDVASLYRKKFPKAQATGQDDIEDFLGELTNRIGGQIKRCLDPDAGDCRIGLPHFIRGAGASFRYKAGTPALAVEFVSDERKFQMELSLHRFDHATIRADENRTAMTPGVVTFL
jgi:CheY-specific phosphatase CheX